MCSGLFVKLRHSSSGFDQRRKKSNCRWIWKSKVACAEGRVNVPCLLFSKGSTKPPNTCFESIFLGWNLKGERFIMIYLLCWLQLSKEKMVCYKSMRYENLCFEDEPFLWDAKSFRCPWVLVSRAQYCDFWHCQLWMWIFWKWPSPYKSSMIHCKTKVEIFFPMLLWQHQLKEFEFRHPQTLTTRIVISLRGHWPWNVFFWNSEHLPRMIQGMFMCV